MKNLENLVRWTRVGLVVFFVLIVLGEIGFGAFVMYREINAGINLHRHLSILMTITGLLLIALDLFSAQWLMRSKTKKMHLLEQLEEKLIAYSKTYSVMMFMLGLAGIGSLLAYFMSDEAIWLLPWLVSLFLLGKSYPFKLNLFHAMGIHDEEERKLFHR